MVKLLIVGQSGYIAKKLMEYMQMHCASSYKITTISARNSSWEGMDFSEFDVLFNAAGIAHGINKEIPLEDFFAVNCDLAVSLAKKAKEQGIRQYIYMSSLSVYGLDGSFGDSSVVDATTPINPATPYGRSKLKAENYLLEMEDSKFKVALLRTPMVYGVNSPGNYQRLRRLALKTLIFPKVPNLRSMIYIENLCQYIYCLIQEYQSGILYPDNTEPINISTLVQEIRRCHGKPTFLSYMLGKLLVVTNKNRKTVQKVFGSLVIDSSLKANDPKGYRGISNKETIALCEREQWK